MTGEFRQLIKGGITQGLGQACELLAEYALRGKPGFADVVIPAGADAFGDTTIDLAGAGIDAFEVFTETGNGAAGFPDLDDSFSEVSHHCRLGSPGHRRYWIANRRR